MGRVVYAEENILSYLKDISQPDVCTTGLILGQTTYTKEYVVLLVRTQEQSDANVPMKLRSVKEIKESSIADHAKNVTKMLPGGMWILGAFICSPTNIFLDSSMDSKTKSILSHLKKQLSSEPLLNGFGPSNEMLLLHFNTTDSQYTCKSYDCNVMNSLKTVDWKFQNNITKWCKIKSKFDVGHHAIGGKLSCSLKEQLEIYLKEINKILEKTTIVLNKQVPNSKEFVEDLMRYNKLDFASHSNKVPVLNADILVPCRKSGAQKSLVLKDCDVELHLMGVLASQILISQKTTVAEAISAIKQDIIRSLMVRFEMHWDSLVEEQYSSPEEKLSIHEPPRRVSVLLPNGLCTLNDYLFPGEGASEVISSFKEILDIDISKENVEKDIEVQGGIFHQYGLTDKTIHIYS
ncbi:hypothetical protein RUM44_005118 [Polyplax serrata]|uniref:Protein odr-4 homolog n=1 Tax=Polyplax serrata TaxID=468196 RepID=A0ABR1AE42_POLSC